MLSTIASLEVLPRFRALSDADIEEKGPGDLVTVADRRAEERLTIALTALLPGSTVVGEEAVSADPGTLERLRGDDPVWIVDPVDGTANFVRGSERFAMLVALAYGGEVVASWTYAPALDVLTTARLGGGAVHDGRHVRVPTTPTRRPGRDAVRRPRVRLTHPVYLSDDHRTRLDRLRTGRYTVEESTSAGLEYVDVVLGHTDALVYTWGHPWDHAAGLLLLKEAGGTSHNVDGSPFALTGGNALPLIATADPELANHLAAHLNDEA